MYVESDPGTEPDTCDREPEVILDPVTSDLEFDVDEERFDDDGTTIDENNYNIAQSTPPPSPASDPEFQVSTVGDDHSSKSASGSAQATPPFAGLHS